MKKYFSLLLVLSLISCASQHGVKKSSELEEKRVEDKIISPINVEVLKGKVKYIEFDVNDKPGVYTLNCKEQGSKNPLVQNLLVTVKDRKAQFFYAESYFSLAKMHNCFFKEDLVLRISVKDFPYAFEKLDVAKGKVTLSKKNLNRVIKERRLTKKVYASSARESYVNKAFKAPLNSFITSHYGKKRIFNNKKRSQHLGNDFRAKVGVQIPVSARGRVAFVGDLFYTGNVVIVDHGLNLFSLYAHLSKINVKAGDIIEQGDIVGLSGMTGRVSGPHLHWGIKLNGHNVDGFSLVNESLKQFSDQ